MSVRFWGQNTKRRTQVCTPRRWPPTTMSWMATASLVIAIAVAERKHARAPDDTPQLPSPPPPSPARSPLAALPASRLLVEYAPSPAVVDVAEPRFSWHISASAGIRGASQAAFRVQVCLVSDRLKSWDGHTWECDAYAGRPCAWDSGRVNSSAHAGIAYGGELPGDSLFGWRVKWWSRTGSDGAQPAEFEAGWSAVASMGTAFIGGVAGFPDNASWIGAAPAAFAAAPLGTTQLRTSFELPAGTVVTRARAYVASPGYYSLRLDGQDADDTVLGAFTVFTRRILYDVLDVTALLLNSTPVSAVNVKKKATTPTRHALAVTLANGWYSQPTVNLGPRMVSIVLRIDYATAAAFDPASTSTVRGGSLVVVSDGTWRQTHGPTVMNDIYQGVVQRPRHAGLLHALQWACSPAGC